MEASETLQKILQSVMTSVAQETTSECDILDPQAAYEAGVRKAEYIVIKSLMAGFSDPQKLTNYHH
jgi:hypothetical protein